MPHFQEATVEDLYRVPENARAELVGGELVIMSPVGDAPGHAALEILVSLHVFGARTGLGRAVPDPVAFIVDLPNRHSFCPDAAFHTGPSFGGRFIEGAPVFAVEVRSESDYGPAAERAMAAKRAEYFAAGTLVVWDVDVLHEGSVRMYRSTAPADPTVRGRGDDADAEPALPGWTFPVDRLFLAER